MKKLIEWLTGLRWFYLPKYVTSKFHTIKLESLGESDIEVCILYGKSRFLQWIYIFNPFKITPYKRKYSKLWKPPILSTICTYIELEFDPILNLIVFSIIREI